MDERLSTDELRDKICHFKKGAESLYRYGDPGNCKTIFDNLSSVDQKKLLYLALVEGDNDIKNIAKYFMQQLTPIPKDEKDLLAQLDPNDKNEIETETTSSHNKNWQMEIGFKKRYKQKVMELLCQACKEIGFLEYEEAFWVLVPYDLSKSAIWLQARGKLNHISSFITWQDHVSYDPGKEEQQKLLSSMRESAFVLHIHNHPSVPNLIYGASAEDCIFAKYWKYLDKELIRKMKFFIIQENTAFEYRENGNNIQWLGQKIESKPLSEKEYYEKQFPLDVAKKMLKEKRKKFYDKLFENE